MLIKCKKNCEKIIRHSCLRASTAKKRRRQPASGIKLDKPRNHNSIIRYKKLQSDKNNPSQGNNLGGGFRKLRFSITSKGKGKSGGGRIITYETIVSITETTIIFVSIYDKSEYENIDLSTIRKNLDIE